MKEWWVIDTRTSEIVNCITASGKPLNVLASFDNPHLTLTLTPTLEQLEGYRYYRGRP